MKPMQGSTCRAVKWGTGNRGYYPGTGRPGGRGGRHTRTSMDEWPSTDVHGAPEAAALCKVPPVTIPIAEHVPPRLLIAVQSVVSAGRARVRWRNELVDRIAFCRLGARQGEGGAEEGAKTCGPVQVNPRLDDKASSSIPLVCWVQYSNEYLREYHARRYLPDAGSLGRCVERWEDP